MEHGQGISRRAVGDVAQLSSSLYGVRSVARVAAGCGLCDDGDGPHTRSRGARFGRLCWMGGPTGASPSYSSTCRIQGGGPGWRWWCCSILHAVTVICWALDGAGPADLVSPTSDPVELASTSHCAMSTAGREDGGAEAHHLEVGAGPLSRRDGPWCCCQSCWWW